MLQLGKDRSWACGLSPRKDGTGRRAAQAQGHSAIVTRATASSLPGTWEGMGGGAPRSLNLGTERGTETRRSKHRIDLYL